MFGSIAYVHVPKEKWRKLDAKAEKCILVSYSDEQKGYKCYIPRPKQARVSRDVVFDESASWYLPTTTDLNSNPNSEDEVSEAEMPPDECEVKTLEESPISFRLSGLNERLSRFDQLDDVERQAQHRPDRLNKPRTRSVQKPGGDQIDIPRGIYLGVSVGAL